MVDAARPETSLCDFETAPFSQQDVVQRHPDVVEPDFRLAERRIVVTEAVHVTDYFHAGRISRHQDH